MPLQVSPPIAVTLANSSLAPTAESTTGSTAIGAMPGPITVFAKGIVIKQTGDSVPADLVTIPIPASITRWRMACVSTSGASSTVCESASSTLAAAQFTAFDATGGGGNAMSNTTNAGPAATGQATVFSATATASSTVSTSANVTIRQTVVAVTSANRTCSFYLVILPLN